MPYKNPSDKKAWRKRYLHKQRELTKAWNKKQSELKRPEREARALEIERRENARVLVRVVEQLKREARIREGIGWCACCKNNFPFDQLKYSGGCRKPNQLAGQCGKCRAKERRLWVKNNPEKAREQRRRNTQRIKASPELLLTKRIRDRTNKALVCAKTRKQQGTSALQYIGCTRDQLRHYIENQFYAGMTWDNYGRKRGMKTWVVDHVIPIASFDLTKESERHKAFHYTNLSPLWIRENARKNARMPDKPHQPRLLLA